jgi:hypothetical protein
MDRDKYNLIKAAMRMADVSADQTAAAMAILEGKTPTFAENSPSALLNQAEKARQLGVGRSTIVGLVKLGKLHPVELLPGLWRYRREELV